jgi:hypothetical protein
VDPRMEALIASTAEVWSYLKNPYQASGACSDMTWRFQCLAREAGFVVEALRCWGPRFACDTTCPRFIDHQVALYQGHVIDWTARQFWRASVFPWIEPLWSFHDKWDRVEPDRGYVLA